jgi:Domain of unknown function (DUF4432)
MAMRLNLNAVDFTPSETKLLAHKGLSVSAFRYASGVAALRVKNRVGEIILLPFHGQQIWDAHFYGRRLTMRSMFDEPVNSRNYLENYGAFLLHCGATAMGNPGPGDHHPLHGELPNAPFQSAELISGEDADGSFVALTGHYRHTIAFAHNYRAEPTLKIYADHARMTLDLTIHNLKHDAMDLMYLAHINFKPVDGAEIVDTVADAPENFRIRDKVPEFFVQSPVHVALIAALKKSPGLHRKLKAGAAIDPELVMGLDFKTDTAGLAHSLQLLPDGSADFISHKPAELPRGVRWITRTANQDALGLFLPGTAEADGFQAEKAKGNLLSIPAGGTFTCTLSFGALSPVETKALRALCHSVVGSLKS